MEFYRDDRVIVNPLRVKNWILSELEASTLLFYTGVSRSSATIIDEQRRNVAEREQGSLQALHETKQEAVDMKESLLKGDFNGLAESMRQAWDSKKRIAHNISNPMIDEVYEIAIAAGARAGKVSGAGGGGFMMFLVDPPRRMDVMRALAGRGAVAGCHFTKYGTQGWRITT
jgi:D-glycero-alpha-D-manno-heptose-7-phosphate kinase